MAVTAHTGDLEARDCDCPVISRRFLGNADPQRHLVLLETRGAMRVWRVLLSLPSSVRGLGVYAALYVCNPGRPYTLAQRWLTFGVSC